ncbi:multidrug efflux system membrane fusion protein [Tamilnaduibacter salinus]|uniref:Multidrug efflux system membrane fusion protein n=1 Tax=Tamilnaduibacter salinus TaxID=1484056 RepID=A0A2U1D0I3_9GAMM|nr:efflux RND transporter periplasmic adaptor subunit [Tamilnaduibacter salinus]PVY78902.1 multidrug efflux system membrane fusion protein [Tamilnaduibacter salinus]
MKNWILRYRSWLVIGVVLGLLLTWMVSGESVDPPVEDRPPSREVAVGVRISQASTVARSVQVQGQMMPEQQVRVRTKTTGEVVETPGVEGQPVKAGEVIARLDMNDRQARLREARANLQRAESDYRAAQRLAQQGFQGALQAERALADRESARARVRSIELDIEHTRIEAPISGTLNRRLARQGDYVTAGEPVAEIVRNDPLRAEIDIPQHRIGEVSTGMAANVTFVDGTERAGKVTYLSSVADQDTRTFLARVEVPNQDGRLPAGTSATVSIPVETVSAHALSPALVSRNADGQLGVKIAVDGEKGMQAQFITVTPVKATANQIWVEGLPEKVRLITLGQGFVRHGDPVRITDGVTP